MLSCSRTGSNAAARWFVHLLYSTARHHALGAPCVAQALFEQPPPRFLQLHELRQRRPHSVDGLKELHELARDFRSTLIAQSLGALGILAHRLSENSFPTALDFRSRERAALWTAE